MLFRSGYYDGLFDFLDHTISEQFVKPIYREMLIMEDEAETLLSRFDNYQAPQVKKWLDPDET